MNLKLCLEILQTLFDFVCNVAIISIVIHMVGGFISLLLEAIIFYLFNNVQIYFDFLVDI